ncbi:MAG: SLC13 family permease [Eubacteriales bacterium]|nr:SLC13 family permease [Eubacteriales bacterium]
MDALTVFALGLFAVTYVVMFTFQRFRPHAAVISACIFVIVGSLNVFPGFRYTLGDALGEIDWNVLMMITGTMGTVFLFIRSKMPQLLSDVIVSHVHSVRWLVTALSLFAGLISAFVDNVATVLMVAPVALAVCHKLKISPVPFIICISVSSNLQGAATLVGDTTSILLGKAAQLDFMDFFFVENRPGMFWVTELGAAASALIILWMFRHDTQRIDLKDRTIVEDKVPALLLCLTVLCLILASFIPYAANAEPGQLTKPDTTNGMICLFFFAVGAIRQCIRDGNAEVLLDSLKEIDYYTITLLAGLFVVIGGIDKAGLIDQIGYLLAGLSGDGSRASVFLIYSIIVWVSVLLSAFIDNIPYTATMLPVVAVITECLSEAGGVALSPNLLYFGLLVGATLGGNLTPIGASANIAGIGILRRDGYEVRPAEFMRFGVPFTLAAVTTGYLLVWFLWA